MRARPPAEKVFFLALCALALVPIWIAPYVPSQDGPSHLETGNILWRHGDAAWGIYREYLVRDLRYGTNLLLPLVLGGLSMVFSYAVAEKLLVSAIVVGIGAATRYALGAIDRDNRVLAGFALLLSYNVLLHIGFYNFCAGLSLFPVAVGVFLRHHPRWTWRSGGLLAALIAVLHLLHPVSLAMTAVTLAVLALWRWHGLRALVAPAAAFLLPTAHVLAFALRAGTGKAIQSPFFDELMIEHFMFLQSFGPGERWGMYAVLALFAAAVVARLLRPARWNPLAGAVVLSLAVYVVAPDAIAGGAMVKWRIPLYVFMLIVLWVATASHGPRTRRLLAGAAALLLAGQVTVMSGRYLRIGRRLTEIHATAASIPPGSTILPLCFECLEGRIMPYLHAASRVALEHHSLNLLHYQATYDFFPVRFKDALNPYEHITWVEAFYEEEKPVDLLGYAPRTGGHVNYVLSWGLLPKQRAAPAVAQLLLQLAAGYERVAVSPSGWVELYRRRR